MSGTKRLKADPLVIGSRDRAESAMMELASLERDLRRVDDDMNDAIDRRKAEAKAESAPLEARKKILMDALGVFAKLNRETLFPDKKSLELAFGLMGFRKSAVIKQMNGVSVEMTLERLRSGGFDQGIRIKESLDKEALRGWPKERLEGVGLVRRYKDEFFVELKEETVTS